MFSQKRNHERPVTEKDAYQTSNQENAWQTTGTQSALSPPKLFAFLLKDIEDQKNLSDQKWEHSRGNISSLGSQVTLLENINTYIWSKESLAFQISSSERVLPPFIAKEIEAAFLVNLSISFSLILVSI